MKKSKSLLIIAYYFPPMGTVGFLRNYHFAKYISRIFDSSFLITIKNIPIPLKDNIPADFINTIRVFNFDYRNAANLVSKKNKLRTKSNLNARSKKIKILRKILDSFPTNILIGEGGVIYIVNAIIKGALLIKKHNITHIYSSYRPVADHFIAYHLKLFFPKLNWTMDYRDPPIDSNGDNVFLEKLQWWFLKKLSKKADNIITVSEGVSNSLSKINQDITTVKNGIYKLFDDIDKSKYPKFTVCYTGSLYPERQNPDIFLKIIKKLLNDKKVDESGFRIIYAGKDSLMWKNKIDTYDLNKISVNEGEVSLKKSIEIQNKSHINLLLTWTGNNRQGILTGKLYEYLATGNPVIALINGEKDTEFEQIFDELNAGYIFYNNDIDKLESTLLLLYRQWLKTGKIKHHYNSTALEKYTWENKINEIKKLMKI